MPLAAAPILISVSFPVPITMPIDTVAPDVDAVAVSPVARGIVSIAAITPATEIGAAGLPIATTVPCPLPLALAAPLAAPLASIASTPTLIHTAGIVSPVAVVCLTTVTSILAMLLRRNRLLRAIRWLRRRVPMAIAVPSSGWRGTSMPAAASTILVAVERWGWTDSVAFSVAAIAAVVSCTIPAAAGKSRSVRHIETHSTV
eukprot:COSAG02_NODE_2806_length_7991_cov_21.891916_9_plen_202_part_00